jgi:hypothetical protein
MCQMGLSGVQPDQCNFVVFSSVFQKPLYLRYSIPYCALAAGDNNSPIQFCSFAVYDLLSCCSVAMQSYF